MFLLVKKFSLKNISVKNKDTNSAFLKFFLVFLKTTFNNLTKLFKNGKPYYRL